MKQDAFHFGASISNGSNSSSRGLLPFSLAAVALFCTTAGIGLLWHHWRGEPRDYRAASGLTLVALGVCQFWIVRRVAMRPSARCPNAGRKRVLPWRWMLVGGVLTYAMGLALGPDSAVGYLCWAALAAWYTVALVPLVLETATVERWKRLASSRPARWGARFMFAAAVFAVVLELGLRAVAEVADHRLAELAAVGERKLPPGTPYHGGIVNQLGYWDDEFQVAPSAGRFRIAALGQAVLLSGTTSTNYLAQIERSVPGIEIYNFGLLQAGPREYAAQFKSDVTPYRPDLVLAFVSIGSDVTQPAEKRGAYDWRGLSSVQWGVKYLGKASTPSSPLVVEDAQDYEAYLRGLARRLAVCRTPIDGTMRHQWEQTTAHLEDLVQQCRKQEIAVGLVLVPGEFQVNSTLCDAVRRRAGIEPGQVDLELPQRRLARFAHERKLPVIDLLPHFRASAASPYCRQQSELNDEGNAIATKVIGGWLQARYGTQIAALTQAAVD